jgi:hypothetical protein
MVRDNLGNIAPDCHPKIRALTDYWLRIRPAAGLPGRRHFDPVDIPDLLANIFLIDVAPGAADFIYRLVGSRVVEFFGADFTGKSFQSAFIRPNAAHAYRDLRETVRLRQPRWRRGKTAFVPSREYTEIERVYLPLAADGETVDMVLGMLLARFPGGEFR